MKIEIIRAALAWSTVINMVFLIWWLLILTLAHDWVYRLHRKWFKLSVESFDTIHYSGIGLFKICIFVFNLVPYLALRIVI